ncbi:hypothetical protein AKO1_004262 [Acrasis kona]|uniref:Uncharacterized protein n=1 Tax=Acrasis kona TaxID=1008807 RepID=A0AAW2Z5X0_9EUKA
MNITIYLYQSSILSPDLLSKFGLSSIIENSQNKEYQDEISDLQNLFTKNVKLIASDDKLLCDIDSRNIPSCKRNLLGCIKKKSGDQQRRRELDSSNCVSEAMIMRCVAYAEGVGLCPDPRKFELQLRQVAAEMTYNDIWLALPCLIIIGDVEAVIQIVKSAQFASTPDDKDVLCEDVEAILYDKYPETYGWYVVNEVENFSHKITSWSIDWFLMDLTFNQITCVLSVCSKIGWRNGFVAVCVLLLRYIAGGGKLCNVPTESVLDLIK